MSVGFSCALDFMHISAIRHTTMFSTHTLRTLKHWFLSLLTLVALASLFSGFAQAQQGLQPVPPLTKLVVDQANILSPTEEEALWQKLLAFEKAKGSQIAVITVPTTAPEDIFSYSQRVPRPINWVGRAWVMVFWSWSRRMTVRFGFTSCATSKVRFPM